MNKSIPAGRLQLDEQSPKPYAAMYRLEQSIELDHGLRNLVKVRASQINGCAFCIDMYWKDARAAGESEARLYSLDAWCDSPLYSERERAALGLCVAITLPPMGTFPMGSGSARAPRSRSKSSPSWWSRSPLSTRGIG